MTKAIPWKRTSKEQAALESLQQALISYPVLWIPINDAPFQVEYDLSDFANGVILSQLIDECWHSHTLLEMEWNYEIYDKEMMAIMDSLTEWRQYLMGSKEPFEIWTDH